MTIDEPTVFDAQAAEETLRQACALVDPVLLREGAPGDARGLQPEDLCDARRTRRREQRALCRVTFRVRASRPSCSVTASMFGKLRHLEVPFKWKLGSLSMAGRPPADPREQARAGTLARHLRALREDRHWSRERLAKEAGIHTRTLVRLESEGAVQPSFFTVAALAEALEISLDELYTSTNMRPGLWSAGYEGRDIESFVSSLVATGIQTVADVRLTPISRKPGFSKTRLGEALQGSGIQYRHLRGLGNPKSNRAPFWEGRLAEGRAEFRRILRTDHAAQDLDALAELAQHSRVAVLCFEQDESRCHRQVVLKAIQKRISTSVTPLA